MTVVERHSVDELQKLFRREKDARRNSVISVGWR
jgi:hypothetical protein